MSKVHRYPLKAFTSKTDYLQINIVNYKPLGQKFNNINISSSPKDENGTEILKENTSITKLTRSPQEGFRRINPKLVKEIILLPMPSSLQDGNRVDYGASSLNSISSGVLSFALGAGKSVNSLNINDIINNITEVSKKSFAQTGLNLENASDIINKQLAASIANSLGSNVDFNQIQSRTDGKVFNPNMELLFNGPALREFQFQFQLTPRNRKESIEIRNIIRSLKKNMAPKAGKDATLYLETPNVFELIYRQGSKEHSFLNKFKQCFLTNLSVDYTSSGNYSTYGDGTPVSTSISLSFQELEPIYDIDYDDTTAGTGVGY